MKEMIPRRLEAHGELSIEVLVTLASLICLPSQLCYLWYICFDFCFLILLSSLTTFDFPGLKVAKAHRTLGSIYLITGDITTATTHLKKVILSVSLSLFLFLSLSHTHTHFPCMIFCLFFCLAISLFVCFPVCLPACLSICLSPVCLSVCLSFIDHFTHVLQAQSLFSVVLGASHSETREITKNIATLSG